VKHLQFLYGMNMFSYWVSIILVDFLKYTLFMIVVYPFLLGFKYSFFIYSLPIIICFSLSITIFCYCFSYLFDAEENGQKFYLMASYLILVLYPLLFTFFFSNIVFSDTFSFNFLDVFPQSAILKHLVVLYL